MMQSNLSLTRTQSVSNGANDGIIKNFKLQVALGDSHNDDSQWLFGILNAMPLLAGGCLSIFVADPLQDLFLGRRGAVAVAALITVASVIGSSFAQTTAQLLGCRMTLAVALGAKASIVPIYTAEVSHVLALTKSKLIAFN